MTAVGANRNKPQNALAGNHRGSLNLLGAEALDQVPPIRAEGDTGSGGNSPMLVTLVTFGAAESQPAKGVSQRRGGEISKPPKITLWSAGVNTC